MLTSYRRHQKHCPHRAEGRQYRRCRCPIWADGFLNGIEIRESLQLRDWERAQQRIREWEAEGDQSRQVEPITVDRACEEFMLDAEARKLGKATLKKYRLLLNGPRKKDTPTEKEKIRAEKKPVGPRPACASLRVPKAFVS